MIPHPDEVVKVLRRRGFAVDEVAPSEPPVRRGLEQVRITLEGEARSAVIAVPDHTRPVPVEKVLDLLIPALEERGVSRDSLLVIFATGTHEMKSEEEAKRMGRWLGKVKFKVHDCKAPHTYVGTTPRGLRVEVDEDFAAADLKVTVGLVAPHPWAGFSGGNKVVLPGVSSIDTVVDHHVKWYRSGRSGVLEGNVFREEIETAGRLAGVDYALNLVVDRNRRVVYASWGDPLTSFHKCVNFASQLYVRRVAGPYDLVVAYAEPLDLNLYQATKALEHAAAVASEGGRIVLIARCTDGYGSCEFELFAKIDREEVVEAIEERRIRSLVPALVALVMKEICEKYEVYLLTEAKFEGLRGLKTVRTLAECEAFGEKALVIREGGFTAPYCA